MPIYDRTAAIGLEWDGGNIEKCRRHDLQMDDVEHVLAHAETLIVPDEKHSEVEPRFIAVGRTSRNRYAFVIFTPRSTADGLRLRPISARYKKEIARYEKENARSQD